LLTREKETGSEPVQKGLYDLERQQPKVASLRGVKAVEKWTPAMNQASVG